MKDLLINTISSLNYPILQQGSLNKDEPYPDSFFTFWNNETLGKAYYNNNDHSCVWDFDLNFYSTDPLLVNTMLLEAKTKLKTAGFIVDGKGHDVVSDEPTHTGRGINVLKIES